MSSNARHPAGVHGHLAEKRKIGALSLEAGVVDKMCTAHDCASSAVYFSSVFGSYTETDM